MTPLHSIRRFRGAARTILVATLLAGTAAHALDPGEDGARVLFPVTTTADSAHAAALDPQGRLTLAGYAASQSRAALARVAGQASDPAFGTQGVITYTLGTSGVAALEALVRQPDGRFVGCGAIAVPGSGSDFLVVRLLADGSLDPTFDGDGIVSTAFAGTIGATLTDRCLAIAVQPDGRIIAAGASAQNGPNNVALVRYLADGALDTTFGSGGRVVVDANASGSADNEARAIVLQPDGRIVIAGRASGPGGNPDLLVMRFLANGSADTSFNATGRVLTHIGIEDTANAVALMADGRIVVAGSAYPVGVSYRDLLVARYLADGRLDASFNGSGLVTTPIGPGEDVARAVALMPWGRIVVAGSARRSTTTAGSDLAVAAYEPDGRLDRFFGLDGRRMITFGSNGDATAYAIVTDLAGARLWLVGDAFSPVDNLDLLALELGLPDTLLRTGFDVQGAP